jgi:hypothetical protein
MYSVSSTSFLGRGGSGVTARPVPLDESLGREFPNDPRARFPFAVRLSPRPHTMAGNDTATEEDVDAAPAPRTATGVKNAELEQQSEEGATMSDAIAPNFPTSPNHKLKATQLSKLLLYSELFITPSPGNRDKVATPLLIPGCRYQCGYPGVIWPAAYRPTIRTPIRAPLRTRLVLVCGEGCEHLSLCLNSVPEMVPFRNWQLRWEGLDS